MVAKKSWQEFRATGLLWWINMILHTFGWAIVVVIDKGEITEAYLARVKYRGFDEKSNTKGYRDVAEYIKGNAAALSVEAHE